MPYTLPQGATGEAFTGNADANYFDGLGGNDYIDGSSGDDTMAGGTGNDTIIVDSALDIVIEAIGGGFDTVAAIDELPARRRSRGRGAVDDRQ